MTLSVAEKDIIIFNCFKISFGKILIIQSIKPDFIDFYKQINYNKNFDIIEYILFFVLTNQTSQPKSKNIFLNIINNIIFEFNNFESIQNVFESIPDKNIISTYILFSINELYKLVDKYYIETYRNDIKNFLKKYI